MKCEASILHAIKCYVIGIPFCYVYINWSGSSESVPLIYLKISLPKTINHYKLINQVGNKRLQLFRSVVTNQAAAKQSIRAIAPVIHNPTARSPIAASRKKHISAIPRIQSTISFIAFHLFFTMLNSFHNVLSYFILYAD